MSNDDRFAMDYFSTFRRFYPMKAEYRQYAQYIADCIDVTILLELRDGLTREAAGKQAGIYLRDEGWCGRKYPLDFFTIATVDLEPPT